MKYKKWNIPTENILVKLRIKILVALISLKNANIAAVTPSTIVKACYICSDNVYLLESHLSKRNMEHMKDSKGSNMKKRMKLEGMEDQDFAEVGITDNEPILIDSETVVANVHVHFVPNIKKKSCKKKIKNTTVATLTHQTADNFMGRLCFFMLVSSQLYL
ncbi:hypothetical protein CEXT_726501 [Caerostris extrusa]|uniref:Uncharacterized protein n=1 Tax=Caerostris extrusa TaxID=172846 RepID=A0AAV4RJE4_CAEEX|nr:hypothetical protein CEXT_726501 [Caerostris extrusa]